MLWDGLDVLFSQSRAGDDGGNNSAGSKYDDATNGGKGERGVERDRKGRAVCW